MKSRRGSPPWRQVAVPSVLLAMLTAYVDTRRDRRFILSDRDTVSTAPTSQSPHGVEWNHSEWGDVQLVPVDLAMRGYDEHLRLRNRTRMRRAIVAATMLLPIALVLLAWVF